MENTIYIALSRLTALRRQMDIVANNVANMNTTGFKGEKVLFEEYVQSAQISKPTSFVRDYGMMRDMANGPIETTHRPLDVALNGTGYFVLAGPEEEFYSRNGAFTLNGDGEITHVSGYPVLGDNGQPIVLDPELGKPTIDSDGLITDGSGVEVGRLDVVTFPVERDLRSIGSGLYTTDQAAQPAEEYSLTQYALEGSNIKAVEEMTRMMSLLRQYQSTQKLIDNSDSLDRKAIQRIGEPI